MSWSPEPPHEVNKALKVLDNLGRRLRAAILVFGLLLPAPLILPMLTLALRGKIGPGDPAVVLWEPGLQTTAYGALFFISLLTAVVLGIMMLFREPGRWWRLVRWPGLVLLVLAIAVAGVSVPDDLCVYRDGLKVSGFDGQGRWEELYGFHEAESVEVGCRLNSENRGRARASLNYSVTFPYSPTFNLRRADVPGRLDSLETWIRAVDALDRSALAGTPRVIPEEGPTVNCVLALRDQLPLEDFNTALRLLGISQADFRRKYL